MDNNFEADALAFTVAVTAETGATLPTFSFVEVLARGLVRRQYGFEPAIAVGTAVAVGAEIDITFPPFSFEPGDWEIQLRAGASEPLSRTVYAERWRISDNIATPA